MGEWVLKLDRAFYNALPTSPSARCRTRRAGGDLGRVWYLRRILIHKTWLMPDKLSWSRVTQKMCRIETARVPGRREGQQQSQTRDDMI